MNKRPESKRNHYNPQMLLRRFVDGGGKLHCYDKRFANKGIITSTPKNLFLETNLYTYDCDDGTKNTKLEKYFSKLEGKANRVINKIIDAARKGLKPNLTKYEKNIWNTFFHYQWKRVPDSFQKNKMLTEFDESFDKIQQEYENDYRPLTQIEKLYMQEPEWRKKFKRQITVESLSVLGPKVQYVLNQKGLGIAVIKNPNKSFVIGSFPVLKLNYPGRSHLMDPSVEVWLPIAHDIIAGPAPIPPNDELVVPIIDDTQVRHINESILKQSTAIAGRSKELIASLIKYS